MCFEEFDQRSEMEIKPFFESVLSGKGRGRGDLGFIKLRFKIGPVHPQPVQGQRRRVSNWVRQSYRHRDMVRSGGGEVSCPFLEERHQSWGGEC